MSFEYAEARVSVRPDLVDANRRAWALLAGAGSWWTGAHRVELAAEVRAASTCSLCAERRVALSPFAVVGEHDSPGASLPAVAVDVVHRLVSDVGRLTRKWFDQCIAAGLTQEQYVEIVGVVTTVVSIDAFHLGIGVALEPLPPPIPGDPSQRRPAGVRDIGAFVPMLGAKQATGDEADLYDGLPVVPNVIAAMSLVPDCVRTLKDLSAAYYLPMHQVADPSACRGVLTRPQVELVAGRVSSLNECFY